MKTDILTVADFLQYISSAVILCHRSPDGDTLGSAFALCFGLRQLGKKARVLCCDPIPQKYSYFTDLYCDEDFEEEVVIAVDVADTKLLGNLEQKYGDIIDLCIDHHPSNKDYATLTYLVDDAAATAQIIYRVLDVMGVEIDKNIANCIFTGLSTDTGCFRYPNTQPETHVVAAMMMEKGAEAGLINRLMFETKSRARLAVEREVFKNMQFFLDERCAVAFVTRDLLDKTGIADDELDGFAAMTRQIEGVSVGVFLKQVENGFKASVRTGDEVDASAVCKRFGGGGHVRAAGCTLELSLEDSIREIVRVISEYLK